MVAEFVQQINDTIKNTMNGMHTAIPGTIASYDPATNTASVTPAMMFKKPDGSKIAYPNVSGVPVVIPQVGGQNVTIGLPIKAGDGCLIIVAEQSMDYWQYEQETDTQLHFDLSNSICIPGLFNKANPVQEEAASSGSVIVDVKGTRITVSDGKVQIDAGEVQINGNLKVSGTIDSEGDATAEGKSVAHHTHTGDSGGDTSEPT